MSKKRFFTKINNKGRLVIIDKECHTELFDMTLACDVLNRLDLKLKHYNEVNSEQQATTQSLKEENDKLRELIKENVFQRYREGSLADLEFKAIAYDDIIKVKLSDESEPKVIVICKQGKKENVKSFCQMFIPFGGYYEIKEGDDEIGRV
jgi:hypothetical protein